MFRKPWPVSSTPLLRFSNLSLRAAITLFSRQTIPAAAKSETFHFGKPSGQTEPRAQVCVVVVVVVVVVVAAALFPHLCPASHLALVVGRANQVQSKRNEESQGFARE